MEYTVNSENTFVKIFNSIEDIAHAFFELIAEEILASMVSGREYHFCLSGGSTPLKIFEYFKNMPLDKMNWENFHIYWGDERCVPHDHPESNYGNALNTILSLINISEDNIHRIRGENSPEWESERYDKEIRSFLPFFAGIPCFGLMMLGIGEDGHTASIFPGQDQLLNSEKLVMPSVKPDTGQERITLTPVIINNSKNIVFIVTGSSKAIVVSEIINRNGK